MGFARVIFATQSSDRLVERRRSRLQEELVFVVHAPAAIEELAELNTRFGVTAPAWSRRDIENHSRKPDGIVIADGGLVAKAADPIDIECFG